jgi:5-methylcytosine-specific restriction enzyme A
VAALNHFNPTIDRYDRRSAARLFDSLWPDTNVSRAIAENLAASIRIAHAAADASWEVTMFSDRVRLNVGQVETLTLREDVIRVFFQAPLPLRSGHNYEITLTEGPIFPSVPVPSGVCDVSPSDVPSLPKSVRKSHEKFVQSAASFKRVSPFKKSFSPAVLEHIESLLKVDLPRPSYIEEASSGHTVTPIPEELDFAQPIIEGARYQVTINAYERDPRARNLCIAKHGAACAICGFDFGEAYGPVADGYIHVHHLRPLSEIREEYAVNPKEDLRPVCPNCHAVLHLRTPPFSIEEVQTLRQQQNKHP